MIDTTHRFSTSTERCVWCGVSREAVEDYRKSRFCAEIPQHADEAEWTERQRSVDPRAGY